jgi:hypothetical protein
LECRALEIDEVQGDGSDLVATFLGDDDQAAGASWHGVGEAAWGGRVAAAASILDDEL